MEDCSSFARAAAANFVAPVRFHASERPSAVAVRADGAEVSYAELCRQSGRLGSWLAAHRVKRVAVLASRSVGACVGVLGAAWGGAAYVPLSLKAPTSRLVAMLSQARCDALLIDRHGAKLLDAELLAAAPRLIVAADDAARTQAAGVSALPIVSELDAPPIDPVTGAASDDAYIIFTSGTTGAPKGVVVSVGARVALIDAMRERYDFGSNERVAETTDLSWDLSVANMIFAWQKGGSLHALTSAEMIAPARFIRANDITVWLSVPSVITTLQRLGMLKPGVFPSLRYSFFAGEGLPSQSAAAWAAAAPNSIVENLYGPTEATFTVIGHRVRPTEEQRMVPIGRPYTTAKAAILGPGETFLADNEKGELVLGGPQLATGYLDREDLTRERFPVIDGRRWYRTGDAAYRDADGLFHHLGRLDNQLKVLGYRVELEDVEAQVRAASGATAVAVIGWPYGAAAVDRLIAFVVGQRAPEAMRAALAKRLPPYMIPSAIHAVDSLPLSANGKLDRARLPALLEAAA